MTISLTKILAEFSIRSAKTANLRHSGITLGFLITDVKTTSVSSLLLHGLFGIGIGVLFFGIAYYIFSPLKFLNPQSPVTPGAAGDAVTPTTPRLDGAPEDAVTPIIHHLDGGAAGDEGNPIMDYLISSGKAGGVEIPPTVPVRDILVMSADWLFTAGC